MTVFTWLAVNQFTVAEGKQTRRPDVVPFVNGLSAGLSWLQALGYSVLHGPDIAPGELLAERVNYGQVILEGRLCQALARLNPALPAEALEDAFRRLTRPEGASLATSQRV